MTFKFPRWGRKKKTNENNANSGNKYGPPPPAPPHSSHARLMHANSSGATAQIPPPAPASYAGGGPAAASRGNSLPFSHPLYTMDADGMISLKATGKGLDETDIAVHQDEIINAVVRYVQDSMRKELGFREMFIPSADAPVKANVFVSNNYESAKKLLVFVAVSRGLYPGLWSRGLVLHAGVKSGSMLEYFRKAIDEGYGIIVANPNKNVIVLRDGKQRLQIPGSASPEEHMDSLWDRYIAPTQARRVYFLGYSYGGVLIKYLLHSRGDQLMRRNGAIALIESSHRIEDGDSQSVKSILAHRTMYWESNDMPFQTKLDGDAPHRTGCTCLSAGKPPRAHSNHYYVTAYCINKIQDALFRFLEIRDANAYVEGERPQQGAYPPRMERATSDAPSQYGDERMRTDTEMSNGSRTASNLQQSERQSKLSVDDFDLLKVIGKGAFGKVMLVRKKVPDGHHNPNAIYAMKVLKKASVFAKNQVEHTKSERRILRDIDHPFVVRLRYAFQSEDKLYLVMDYYNGGSLFFHLKKSRKFSEKRAKFYAAQLVVSMAHLHELNIAYRDLKLENILMDDRGFIALTDFGLSKENVDVPDGAKTFCGTAEYIAPELLKGLPYGKAVDWWGFGTLLYEMMTGQTPFFDRNRKRMFHNILHRDVVFTSAFSEEAKDLLTGSLTMSLNNNSTICFGDVIKLWAKSGHVESEGGCVGFIEQKNQMLLVVPPIKEEAQDKFAEAEFIDKMSTHETMAPSTTQSAATVVATETERLPSMLDESQERVDTACIGGTSCSIM
ncbi:hypothetical protein ATCC90586_002362 [Pythium insidiosum]|nr:hypothetical protein ATCC90586_002362 [Pythium insidiosum]